MAIDWLKIRLEYINSVMSYRELAEKHGVSHSTMRKKAASEKWSDARIAQRNKIQARAEQKTQEKAASALSQPMAEKAIAKARIATKAVKMLEDWMDRHSEGVEDTGDIRRIIQSCLDVGVFETDSNEEASAAREPDALTKALMEEAEKMNNANQS